MPKTTYKATDANGVVHTRKSERTYTHTVVVQYSRAVAVKNATERQAYNRKHGEEQFAHAGRTIEQLKAFLIAKRCEILARDDVYATKMQTESKAFVERWHIVDNYVAAQFDADLAKINATDWSVWHNQGWCGRPDLARKLANSQVNRAAVAILEAVAA